MRVRTRRRISVQEVYEIPARGEYTMLFSRFVFTIGMVPRFSRPAVDRAEPLTLESTTLELHCRVARRRAVFRLSRTARHRADADSAFSIELVAEPYSPTSTGHQGHGFGM
jgi:hypothetical protein